VPAIEIRARLRHAHESYEIRRALLNKSLACSHGPVDRLPIVNDCGGADRPQVRTPDGFVPRRTGWLQYLSNRPQPPVFAGATYLSTLSKSRPRTVPTRAPPRL